jgi:hypothetical protein
METKKKSIATKYKVGNLLYNESSREYFKIIEKDNIALVWQINFGVWGTLENFKQISKDHKQKFIVVNNFKTNPQVLNEIKKPFFNLENYLKTKK